MQACILRAGDEEPQDRPSAPDTDGSQAYGYVQIPLVNYDELSLRARRFTIRLPRDRALAILVEFDDAVTRMWTEMVCGPRASMVIHQIMMEANACLSLARETRGEAANIARYSGCRGLLQHAEDVQGEHYTRNMLYTGHSIGVLDEFNKFFDDMYLYKSI